MGKAARSNGRRREAPVVGFAGPRERLRQVLRQVVDDGSRLVLVGGDAGGGKTTLVQAFADELAAAAVGRPVQVIRGQCVPLGGEGLPFAPIVGALRELVASHSRSTVLGWAGSGRSALGMVLPDLVSAPTPDESTRLRLFEVVALLWEHASAEAPLVVVLEDLHWADESTRHLLRFLVPALADASVMIVATYRTDELTRRRPLRPFLAEAARLPTTVRIELPSLDRTEVGQMLTHLLGRTPEPGAIEVIHRRSEGIPYFVEELARSVPRGCINLPDTLRDALNVRVQALSDSTQAVLRMAAVAGQRVEHELLAAVSGLAPGELEQALREAVDAGVLLADETGYEFRHALLHEVVHDDLLPGEHARLHARFAAQLEERPDLVESATAPLEIAHHWSAAHETAKAFSWSIRAATSESVAYPEALKMYERALELWDQVEDPEAIAGPRASVLQRAASAAGDAGETERALALITAALAEGGLADREAAIKRLMAKSALLNTLMRPGAVEAMQTAVDLLPDDAEPSLRAKVVSQLATRLMLAGSYRAATEAAQTAVELAVDAGSPGIESHARNTLGSCLVALGREQEGLAELARSGELAAAETRTLLRYSVNYSDALNLTARYAEAVEEGLAGVRVAGLLGLERTVGGMLAGNTAEPLIALGQWERADKMISRALELDPPAHDRVHLRLLQAHLRLWQGQLEAAKAILLDFQPLTAAGENALQHACHALRIDAQYALVTGDPERAWQDVTRYFASWERYPASTTYPLLAVAAAAARTLDVAAGSSERGQLVGRYLTQAKPIAVRGAYLPVIEGELADTRTG
ncbi:MAG: ATP-binding protein [Actinomycetes bacterium]